MRTSTRLFVTASYVFLSFLISASRPALLTMVPLAVTPI